MPKVSEFFGIMIVMYYSDHFPAHFHAIYGQLEAKIGIEPIRVIEGQLPRRVLSLVFEWAAIYQGELKEDWELARMHAQLKRIPPLE